MQHTATENCIGFLCTRNFYYILLDVSNIFASCSCSTHVFTE